MAKEKTQAMLNKENFLKEGKSIPKCVNEGCDNNVVVRDWKYYSFKHLCSDCAKRMKLGQPPRDGVTFSKKDYCENIDGRLGFV